MNTIPRFFAPILAGFVIGGFLAFNALRTTSSPVTIPSRTPIQSPEPAADLVTRSFAAAERWTINPNARVFILPHHLVASRQITSLISNISHAPRTVYLIAPDHFSQGRTPFTTTDHPFTTSQGTIEVDRESVDFLQHKIVRLRSDANPFTREHGIGALLPFLRHTWPETKIVPIMVRVDTSSTEIDQLTTSLTERLTKNPDAIVISSLDFSHSLPQDVADFHDAYAEDVLRSLDYASAPLVEIDSPPGLAAILSIAHRLGLGTMTAHAHTNSLHILESKLAYESTSHFIVSFSPGDAPSPNTSTLLVLTDAIRNSDTLDRVASARDISKMFSTLKGAEGRFFQGQDFIIGHDRLWSATASGTRLESRGRPARIIHVDTMNAQHEKDAVLITIEEATRRGEIVIANIRSDRAGDLSKTAIDRGADFVLRMDSSSKSTIEIYHGRPIATITGSDGSRTSQTGFVFGLETSLDGHWILRLFPIKLTKDGQKLLLGDARRKALNELARISEENLREDLQNGVLYGQLHN